LTENEQKEVLPFITFEKSFKDGKELIFFDKEEKEMFFNHFPEIKEIYDLQHFGKFGDRKFEEA